MGRWVPRLRAEENSESGKRGHEVGCCERRESRGWKQMTGWSCNSAGNLAKGKEALGNSGLYSSDGYSVYSAKLFLY